MYKEHNYFKDDNSRILLISEIISQYLKDAYNVYADPYTAIRIESNEDNEIRASFKMSLHEYLCNIDKNMTLTNMLDYIKCFLKCNAEYKCDYHKVDTFVIVLQFDKDIFKVEKQLEA